MLKKIAIVLIAVGALLLAAGAIFLATFDVNHYKPQAIEWMKAHKQRTLAIDGPIGLSVFPQLAVTLSDVRLSEKLDAQGRAEPFAQIQRARLALQIMPLLARRIEVGKVEAQGVQLTYLRDAQGVRNIDDLLAGPAGAQAPATPSPAAPASAPASAPMHFDVRGVSLHNVTLRVRDEQSRVDGVATLARLETGRLASGVESPVSFDMALDFKAPAVRGTLTGRTRLQIDLDPSAGKDRADKKEKQAREERLTLTNADLTFRGDTPSLKNAQLSLKGTLALDAARSAMAAHQLQATVSGQVAGLLLDGAELSVAQLDYEPGAQKLQLQTLALDFKARQGGNPLRARLNWPQLQVQGESLGGSALSGDFELGGSTPVTGKFTSSAPAGNFTQLRIPRFKLTLDGGAKGSGEITTDIGVQPAGARVTLEKLQGSIKAQAAGLPQAFSVAGAASYTGGAAQAVQWDLRGVWGGGPYSTSGNAVLAGAVPTIHAKFELARFNTQQLTPAAQPSASSEKNKAPVGISPAPEAIKSGAAKQATTDAIDLSPATAFKGSIDASVGRLTVRNIVFESARVSLRGDGKRLDIPAFAAKVWQGTLSGSGAVVPASKSIALKGAAEGVRIEQALKDLSGRDHVSGRGRVVVDVRSAGATLAQIRSGLDGKAQVQLRDGAIKGINLAKSLREAKAALTLRKDNVHKARQEEKTDFSEISASFDIAQGVAHSKDLDGKSPFLRLAGEGQIDIGRGTIDYLAKATLTDTAQGQDAAELAALRGVQVPVKLSGPLEAMEYKVQWSAVTASVAKEALKGKVGDALKDKLGLGKKDEAAPAAPAGTPAQPQSPKDKLRDKLKGLLR